MIKPYDGQRQGLHNIVYKYEMRSSGYPANTVYARNPNEALLAYRNNCWGGEASAGLDYLICRGRYNLVKGKDINFDAFEVVFARVDKTCEGEPIPPTQKGVAE
jgi:hypothetical protein